MGQTHRQTDRRMDSPHACQTQGRLMGHTERRMDSQTLGRLMGHTERRMDSQALYDACQTLGRLCNKGCLTTHLFLGDAHSVVDVGEDRRLNEVTLVTNAFTTGTQLGSLLPAALYQLQYLGCLIRVDLTTFTNKAVTDRRLHPRCCHLPSYFKRPKSSPVHALACNWYYCGQLIAKPKAAYALRCSRAATSSNLGL